MSAGREQCQFEADVEDGEDHREDGPGEEAFYSGGEQDESLNSVGKEQDKLDEAGGENAKVDEDPDEKETADNAGEAKDAVHVVGGDDDEFDLALLTGMVKYLDPSEFEFGDLFTIGTTVSDGNNVYGYPYPQFVWAALLPCNVGCREVQMPFKDTSIIDAVNALLAHVEEQHSKNTKTRLRSCTPSRGTDSTTSKCTPSCVLVQSSSTLASESLRRTRMHIRPLRTRMVPMDVLYANSSMKTASTTSDDCPSWETRHISGTTLR